MVLILGIRHPSSQRASSRSVQAAQRGERWKHCYQGSACAGGCNSYREIDVSAFFSVISQFSSRSRGESAEEFCRKKERWAYDHLLRTTRLCKHIRRFRVCKLECRHRQGRETTDPARAGSGRDSSDATQPSITNSSSVSCVSSTTPAAEIPAAESSTVRDGGDAEE
jgi:hypothetical protein